MTGNRFRNGARRSRQTENAVERFWKPILVSALSEDLDRISVSYCRASRPRIDEDTRSPPHGRAHASASPNSTTGLETIFARAAAKFISVPHWKTSLPIRRRSTTQGEQEGKPDHFEYLIVALPFEVRAAYCRIRLPRHPLREAFRISNLRPSPVSTCGLTGRSPIWITPFCSTERSSGCFTSLAYSRCAQQTRTAPSPATSNSWSVRRKH